MGLCNSLSTFQRLVDIIFSGLLHECAVAYVDDLNIYSSDMNNYFQYLCKVFDHIQIAGLLLNLKKYEFFKSSISFLGYIVSANSISIDSMKIKKITNFSKLRNITKFQ